MDSNASLRDRATTRWLHRKVTLLNLSGFEAVKADYELYCKNEDYRKHLALVSGELARLRALQTERRVVHHQMKLIEGLNEYVTEPEQLSCRFTKIKNEELNISEALQIVEIEFIRKRQPALMNKEMEAIEDRLKSERLQRQQDEAK
ncbi:hypothetical protein RUND412_001418 [Rhizina undulata]